MGLQDMFDKPCIPENKISDGTSTFWTSENEHLKTYLITWAVAGVCMILTLAVSVFTVIQHSRSYINRKEQRQIIRILYLPPVYSILSFLSYRYFLYYTYFELVKVVYEAVALSAFMLLLLEYAAAFTPSGNVQQIVARKDKGKLPPPWCCFRYRPTKAYFLHTIKWLVLQYVIIRPLVTIIAIICEAQGVLCESAGFNLRYASVYLSFIGTFSMLTAMYGLILFYLLTKKELENRRPLSKFLCIKLMVFLGIFQSFIFSSLEGHVIHETEYLTEANVANGLNAILTCVEMAIFSFLYWWAFPSVEYRTPGAKRLGVLRALADSINYLDFAHEIANSFRFFMAYFRGDVRAHGHGHLPRNPSGRRNQPKTYIEQAYNLDERNQHHVTPSTENLMETLNERRDV
ncbi:organic solute transporter Ostalpha-domain-containing protein [Flagelloscypha sp. PMI_526]|nr:organic solute transporter Ostalpha-domain-containing protein [Flagelloscypha sp. PMI_526]